MLPEGFPFHQFLYLFEHLVNQKILYTLIYYTYIVYHDTRDWPRAQQLYPKLWERF